MYRQWFELLEAFLSRLISRVSCSRRHPCIVPAPAAPALPVILLFHHRQPVFTPVSPWPSLYPFSLINRTQFINAEGGTESRGLHFFPFPATHAGQPGTGGLHLQSTSHQAAPRATDSTIPPPPSPFSLNFTMAMHALRPESRLPEPLPCHRRFLFLSDLRGHRAGHPRCHAQPVAIFELEPLTITPALLLGIPKPVHRSTASLTGEPSTTQHCSNSSVQVRPSPVSSSISTNREHHLVRAVNVIPETSAVHHCCLRGRVHLRTELPRSSSSPQFMMPTAVSNLLPTPPKCIAPPQVRFGDQEPASLRWGLCFALLELARATT